MVGEAWIVGLPILHLDDDAELERSFHLDEIERTKTNPLFGPFRWMCAGLVMEFMLLVLTFAFRCSGGGRVQKTRYPKRGITLIDFYCGYHLNNLLTCNFLSPRIYYIIQQSHRERPWKCRIYRCWLAIFTESILHYCRRAAIRRPELKHTISSYNLSNQ